MNVLTSIRCSLILALVTREHVSFSAAADQLINEINQVKYILNNWIIIVLGLGWLLIVLYNPTCYNYLHQIGQQ